ncbi:hypothetical protein I311_05786 [Cryptococcus gattii NT-10]|nr:hypothetical protein I311_05786 [Cryptococcus gattii NT-10]
MLGNEKLPSWLVPLKKLTSILGTYLCPLFISIRRSVDSCLQRTGRLAMFYMAVYDSITELFTQALLVHHVMVLEPLGSLTTAEAIGDLIGEGRAFCTFPLWNCEEEGQRESIYEKCHPVYSGECQQSIWQGMSGGGGCSEADALPSTISVLKAEEWMGRRGIVEGQEEIAKIPHHCHDVMQESQSLTSGTDQPTFIRPSPQHQLSDQYFSSSSSLSSTYPQSTSSIYETPERTESTPLSSSLSPRITKLFYTVISPSCSIVFATPVLSASTTRSDSLACTIKRDLYPKRERVSRSKRTPAKNSDGLGDLIRQASDMRSKNRNGYRAMPEYQVVYASVKSINPTVAEAMMQTPSGVGKRTGI